ncbi:hypothetical protein SAMN05660477_01499 [Soonwooa buanensis]|uniref:Uncharacterized protein n=1 Tax=Soonwooa buanensis TaxID=619805 RepID=A0A1T5ER96_9FLAO|nr:hypothetical protein [Soonwooa buanensis]SKB86435.1 hypothetical protein SAMN05660477_01499 [Soonwooa buanensis]
MALQDFITQIWTKSTGRQLNSPEDDWLLGPIGDSDLQINYADKIAKEDNLYLDENSLESGLMEDDFFFKTESDLKIDPKILDFYQKTSNYNFGIEASWNPFFKIFSNLLQLLFSNRLQQLNLPSKSADLNTSLISSILKLKNKSDDKTVWTIWNRKSAKTQKLIFSGIYTFCKIKDKDFFKIIFPLPNGNASVLLEKEILKDGSLVLKSNGKKFGESGFYFVLKDKKDQFYGRFVKTMHERLDLKFNNDKQQIDALHQFSIWGITFLKLKYTIKEKVN